MDLFPRGPHDDGILQHGPNRESTELTEFGSSKPDTGLASCQILCYHSPVLFVSFPLVVLCACSQVSTYLRISLYSMLLLLLLLSCFSRVQLCVTP